MRPIGKRLRQVCEALEDGGPTRPSRMAVLLGVSRQSAYNYLRRAEKHGMAARTGLEYMAAPGWRFVADLTPGDRKKDIAPVSKMPRHELDDWMHSPHA